MSRSKFIIPFSKSFNEAESDIKSILKQNHFYKKEYHNEIVWKKGSGIATAMQYVKTEYDENTVTLHAWVQAGIGDFGGSEMNLEGAFAYLPKKSLLKVIQQIEHALK